MIIISSAMTIESFLVKVQLPNPVKNFFKILNKVSNPDVC